ncbi:hypothetical protein JCM8097_006228 [Rhodosporidiobolus ruineniae]
MLLPPPPNRFSSRSSSAPHHHIPPRSGQASSARPAGQGGPVELTLRLILLLRLVPALGGLTLFAQPSTSSSLASKHSKERQLAGDSLSVEPWTTSPIFQRVPVPVQVDVSAPSRASSRGRTQHARAVRSTLEHDGMGADGVETTTSTAMTALSLSDRSQAEYYANKE